MVRWHAGAGNGMKRMKVAFSPGFFSQLISLRIFHEG